MRVAFNHTQLNDLDFEFALEGEGYTCTDDGDVLDCTVNPEGGVATIWFKFSAHDPISLGDAWHYWVTASYLSSGEVIADWDDWIVFDEWLQEQLGILDQGAEIPDTPEADPDTYSYRFLDQVLEGANPNTVVPAEPQFHVAEEPAEDRAATIVTFTDSISLELLGEGVWRSTDHAYTDAAYDNCHFESGYFTCLLIGFAPEAGTTYGLADDSPLTFSITDEGVTEDDAAAYWAEDLNEAELAEFVETTGVDLDYNENSNLLSLVETEPSDGDFYTGYGLFLFLADSDEVDELPGHETDDEAAGSGQLPVTGNSSIVLISSAAAALLAGAVVFFLLRRRKAAQNWE